MMTRVIASELFGAIHVVAIVSLIVMLRHAPLRGWFARRFVGEATAVDLAWVRIVACAALILYVFTEDLSSLARLAPKFYEWPGYLLHLGRGALEFFVTSAPHLRLLTALLLVLLVLGLFGVATRVTIPLAAITYLVYAALLRSIGKYFHDGYLVMYVMIVLSLLPCGDAWSFDAWWRRRRGAPARDAAYGWMVWACFAALCVPYLQLATSKLSSGGLFWFDGHSLRNYMLTDDLNLTEWDIDLALGAIGMPTFLWTISGFFALATEIAYPLVLVLPRLRRVLPYCVALLHLGVWLGQDALFLDAILMPLIFLRPGRFAWARATAPVPGATVRRGRGAAIPILLVIGIFASDQVTYRVTFHYRWPLEGWQMYAGKTNLDLRVSYRRFVVTYRDGRVAPNGLEDCAAFLVKPYRLDFGLIHDLPGFLTTCTLNTPGARALSYENRSWRYRTRTLAQHLTDPPETSYTIALLDAPAPALRATQAGPQLLAGADFEQIDLATGLTKPWVVPDTAFVGLGFDPANANHALLLRKHAGATTVRQEITVEPTVQGVTASVLGQTRAAGSQLVIEVDGKPAGAAALPADGVWHRVALSVAVHGGAKVAVALVASDDTYFDDAALTPTAPPVITPDATPGTARPGG